MSTSRIPESEINVLKLKSGTKAEYLNLERGEREEVDT